MPCCFVCLDDETPAGPTGCACRGDAGHAHAACLAQYAACAARHRGPSVWLECATCKQQYTGAALRALAERWCEATRGLDEAERERVSSAMVLSHAMKQGGEFEAAERMQREAFEVCSAAHGSEHRQTLFVADFLLDTLVDSGQHASALELGAKLVARPRSEAHQELYSACTYGKALMYTGALRGARRVLGSAVTRSKRRLGAAHGITRRARVCLARCVAGLGALGRARRELAAVREYEARVLGAEHPDTVSTSFELARVLALSGSAAEARELCAGVVAARAARLAPGHPDLVVATTTLATLDAKVALTQETKIKLKV
jgi:hypothetical protein